MYAALTVLVSVAAAGVWVLPWIVAWIKVGR